jgi:membrane-associated phospholipid phosphatase
MCTLKWYAMRLVVMTLVLLAAMVLPARGDVVSGGPQVGLWKTWVLTAGTEIQVPAPPAETSDQTKAELAELRQMQKERSPITNTAIQYYNAVPATQRWHDLAHALARAEKQSLNRQARLATILHTALHDAVIATWAAKYQFHRKPPSQMAPDVTPVVLVTGAVPAPEPSYPSEHAALAGTAVGILTAFFPKEEANLQAMAAEAGQTRLLMGANSRSDIEAGFALGQAVAQKALARAATDGSDAKWTGTVPTGARDVGRKRPDGAIAGDLETVADDTRRSVLAGAAASHRLSRVPGGAGVAEAHQQPPDAVPARHRH